MTVVVYSFVAEIVILLWFVLLFFVVFPTLFLQVSNRLGFWGGSSCFVSFIWCQLFACLIRAAIFRLPPAFVVWSFFATGICGLFSFFATGICVQSLSFTAFSAVGICVRLFVFALLALFQGISVSLSFGYHAVHLLLHVIFILGDSNWNFFQVGYPVDSPTNSTLKQIPFGIPP